jgi:hypothetical protein
MEVFKHLLIRISPISFSEFEKLSINETSRQALHEYEKLKQDFMSHSIELTQTITQIICQTPDVTERTNYLKIKRCVQASRQIDSNLSSLFDNETLLRLKHYSRLHTLERSSFIELKKELSRAYIENKERLKLICNDFNLQAGLSLSSVGLFNNLHKYYALGINSTKKDSRFELGIIKYLSRIVAKTSPYSTFTHVGSIPITNEGTNNHLSLFSIVKKESAPKSYLRLNTMMLPIFIEILKSYPPFYRNLRIRLNPTIQSDDNKFSFVFNTNNIDVFQEIENNALLTILFDILTTHRMGVIYDELINIILSLKMFDTNDDKLEKQFKQLIDFGFIEFDIGISGVDPSWDVSLVSKLKDVNCTNDELLSKFSATLNEIRIAMKKYGVSDVFVRKDILLEIYSKLVEIYLQLHEAANLSENERKLVANQRSSNNVALKQFSETKKKGLKAEKERDNVADGIIKHQSITLFYFKPEQILYEDVEANISGEMCLDEITPIILSLNSLVKELRHFDAYKAIKLSYEKYFKQNCTSAQPLLSFYKSYYEDYKSSDNNNVTSLVEIPKDKIEDTSIENVVQKSESINLKEQWEELLVNSIIEQIESFSTSIRINAELLNRISTMVFPLTECESNTSRSAMIQVYYDKTIINNVEMSKVKGVLNGLFPGYGKMMGRFLYMFDKNINEELLADNRILQQDSQFGENKDASYFNANIHTSLLDYEIWVPGSHSSLPFDKQIPITKLEIYFDDHERKLLLRNADSGKQVKMLDLGFQHSLGRSELFNFISRICADNVPSFDSIITPINKKYIELQELSFSKKITCLPRIVYNDNIIIQRRAWITKTDSMPIQDPQKNKCEYLIELNEWRIKHKLPENIFVTLSHNYLEQKNLTDKEVPVKTELQNDDYKPQYINFLNPLLVNLFSDLLRKAKETIYIEEMLPGRDQLLQVESEGYATEFVVQWRN